MLSAADVVARSSRRGTTPPDLGSVERVLVSIDQGAVLMEMQGRVRWELWDGVSPINGCDADVVKSRSDWLDGVAYLVYVDGAVVYFQPYDPSGAAPSAMTEAQAAAAGAAQAAAVAQRMADGEVTRLVAQAV